MLPIIREIFNYISAWADVKNVSELMAVNWQIGGINST